MYPEAYLRGYDHGSTGGAADDNPYSFGSDNYDIWLDGWRDGSNNRD